MFGSDDVVFAWAIGKALLIVVVAFGILVYAAWVVTRQGEDAAQGGISEDGALQHKSSVRAGTVVLIGSGATEEAGGGRRILAVSSTEEIDVYKPEEPAPAA
jgi:hypothetical protein